MKALELGYVRESEKCHRVRTQQHRFKELFATLDDTEIVKCLQKGFSIALEHLRTLDVGRKLSVHIQCAFDITVTCLNKWLFFKDWIGCGGLP